MQSIIDAISEDSIGKKRISFLKEIILIFMYQNIKIIL